MKLNKQKNNNKINKNKAPKYQLVQTNHKQMQSNS